MTKQSQIIRALRDADKKGMDEVVAVLIKELTRKPRVISNPMDHNSPELEYALKNENFCRWVKTFRDEVTTKFPRYERIGLKEAKDEFDKRRAKSNV